MISNRNCTLFFILYVLYFLRVCTTQYYRMCFCCMSSLLV